jgi:predicted P-loop ATPase
MTLKELHKLGLAIHWVKPKSKMPVESGWTKGPRKTWDELERAYHKEYNVGVRLGSASKFSDGTYLTVIDCDVKSTDPRHLGEMTAALLKICPMNVKQAVVHSGRGNGSRHLYTRTKTPIAPRRISQSSDKVKVHMPSSAPSKHELEVLTADEIKKGIRLRAAWEISVMGEGQQVVLPPSIHPDSGKAYAWGTPVTDLTSVPLIELNYDRPQAKQKPMDSQGFKEKSVDLLSSPLPDRIVDLILSGTGCDDRSASLFTVAIAMLKENFDVDQILTVLTDRDTFLGQAAFDHAKTNSRVRAAEWVRKYTLGKVIAETSAAADFERDAVTETLSDTEAAKQTAEVVQSSDDWKSDLDRTLPENGNKVKDTLKNVRSILVNMGGLDIFRRDLFAGTNIYGACPPWNEGKVGDEIRDIDVTNIIHWLVDKFKVEVSESKVHSAIAQISSKNAFHPVRDYLDGLEWDGKPRIDNWIENYLEGHATEPYLSAVSRKVLCAMIARVMNPGVKFDHVLILEGTQGVGKSTAVRVLADPWYSDAHINIADKDSIVSMKSVWVMEMGELSGMRKADVDHLKEFVSRQVDRLRMPYGRLAENFPRQCIFIGTTNSDEYLKDTTGNRRFWPVKVGKCNFRKLKRDRDQLLAEAVVAYNLGETLYLNEREETAAQTEQAQRTFVDEWVNLVGDFLSKKQPGFDVEKFTISELCEDFTRLGIAQPKVGDQMRMASVLKILGYKKFREKRGDTRKRYWVRDLPNLGTDPAQP